MMVAQPPAPQQAQTSSTKNSNRNTREIRYPVLHQVAELQTDDYWKKIYSELSYGKYLKINADGKTVYFKSTNKKNYFTYTYAEKTPEVISSELTTLLRKILVQTSRKDEEEEKKILVGVQDTYYQACKEDSWKKIKTRKMREMLLSQYVLEIKNVSEDMSWDQCRNMYNCLCDAFFTFHTHSGDHVHMRNGVIVRIDGIDLSTYPPRNLILDAIDDFEGSKLKEKVKKKAKSRGDGTTVKKRSSKKGTSSASSNTDKLQEDEYLDLMIEQKNYNSKVDVVVEWQKYVVSLYKKAAIGTKDEDILVPQNVDQENENEENEEDENDEENENEENENEENEEDGTEPMVLE